MTRTLGLALALVLAAITALAQPQPAAGPGDPHGVARLSIVIGDVSIQRGDSDTRTAGVVNAPLMAGDIVAAGQGGRTEIQFDSANMARLDSNSELRLAGIAPNHYQVQVGRGTMMFSQVRESHADIEIDTPQVAVRPKQTGAYRISIFDDHAEITVRVGQAEIYTPGGSETLDPGKTMMVRGNPSDPEFQMVNAIEQDDFDHWNAGRDQQLNRSTSSRRVNPEIYGTEDMDDNGRWVNTPDYGSVWSPTVGPDWAPYRDGQWVWEDYYGWTWVSYEPWGWAPYHYGRWFFRVGIGWCWYPGPVFSSVYWSPALVAFFGFGGGAGFGWVPLGPFEAIHPWWGRGVYGTHVAVVNNINVYNTYRNARVAGGVTAVHAADFGHGRIAGAVHVSSAQLRTANLLRGQLPAPTAASRRFSERAVSAPVRATNFRNTHFFSRSQQTPGGWRRFESTPPSLNKGWHTPGDRPPMASQPRYPGATSGSWRRFPPEGGRTATRYGAPRPLQIAPPIVRERSSAPASSGERGGSYSAPSAPAGGHSGAGGGGGHSHR